MILFQAVDLDEERVAQLASILMSSRAVEVFESTDFHVKPESLVMEYLRRDDLSAKEADVYRAARSWVIDNTKEHLDSG